MNQESDRENVKMVILVITIKFLASCIISTLTNEFLFCTDILAQLLDLE